MTRVLPALAVVCGALFLGACEGSAARGGCATTEDVGVKITVLTDDLKKAEAAGKIDAARAGDIAAHIMDAGAKFGAGNKHRAYCEALDRIRKDAGL